MIFPIVNQQISTRVTAEELAFLNELIGNLMPEQDWAEPTLTLRTVFMKIAETAASKLAKSGQSKPEDLKRIQELENLLNTEKEVSIEESKRNEKYQSKIDELITAVSKLETRNLELETRNSELETLNSELGNEHTQVKEKALKLEKYAPVPNELRIILEPLSGGLLNLYAEKIRLRTKGDVSPGEILTTLFNRYVTKRETELPGFPFLVSKAEIIQLAKELEHE